MVKYIWILIVFFDFSLNAQTNCELIFTGRKELEGLEITIFETTGKINLVHKDWAINFQNDSMFTIEYRRDTLEMAHLNFNIFTKGIKEGVDSNAIIKITSDSLNRHNLAIDSSIILIRKMGYMDNLYLVILNPQISISMYDNSINVHINEGKYHFILSIESLDINNYISIDKIKGSLWYHDDYVPGALTQVNANSIFEISKSNDKYQEYIKINELLIISKNGKTKTKLNNYFTAHLGRFEFKRIYYY